MCVVACGVVAIATGGVVDIATGGVVAISAGGGTADEMIGGCVAMGMMAAGGEAPGAATLVAGEMASAAAGDGCCIGGCIAVDKAASGCGGR
jgi:hypothetical protein